MIPIATHSTGEPPPPDGAGAEDRITELRARIDEIDMAIIELWRVRAAISNEVGATRVAAGGTRIALAREYEIVARYRDALGSDGTRLATLVLRAGRGPRPLPSI